MTAIPYKPPTALEMAQRKVHDADTELSRAAAALRESHAATAGELTEMHRRFERARKAQAEAVKALRKVEAR